VPRFFSILRIREFDDQDFFAAIGDGATPCLGNFSPRSNTDAEF